jgi:hypothetical protein
MNEAIRKLELWTQAAFAAVLLPQITAAGLALR